MKDKLRSHMSDSIFTKIINGDIPSFKVYEDDKTYAFMDIHPIQPGHVLVVTKNPIVTFEELPDEDYQALMATVKRIAVRIKEVFQPLRVGVIIEGFEVDHVHVKVFPINNEKELRRIPDSSKEPDMKKIESLAAKLKIED